ncbi:cytochrome aa3 quinol oxidase subunit IV [Cohnella laeviribosi]|uniref:cytochrome aa3 quinol oxidase subunit IV n=1 Tax=Cohnella laeviribosi TaxID=380174 RepID=UPI0003758B82|nr:cytochrome aa3 quinol oxidase subunit IV [Cohnella laeviribosi]
MAKPQAAVQNKRTFPFKHFVGYLFSIVLTLLAVWVAFESELPAKVIMNVIYIFAFLQAALQLLMFMHITETSNGRIQTGTILFAVFIAITVAAGSVWVMSAGHS